MPLLRLLLAALLLAGPALAQDVEALRKLQGAQEEAISKQRAAIEQQREAVRRQVRSVQPEADSAFYTAPWVRASVDGLVPGSPDSDCEAVPEEQIGPLVEEISRREGLTPDLLRAVIYKESRYLPCAVSRKGAQGLMQLMPGTASDLGVANPFNPRENVQGGARLLKQLLTRYDGDLKRALGAYNAGPGRVDAAGGVPLIPETMDYVSDILDRLERK